MKLLFFSLVIYISVDIIIIIYNNLDFGETDVNNVFLCTLCFMGVVSVAHLVLRHTIAFQTSQTNYPHSIMLYNEGAVVLPVS